MTLLKWLIIGGVVFGGLVVVMYAAQRSLMYLPERQRTAPDAAGLFGAEEHALKTADGETVIVWHVPPKADRPVVLYFHGNGGSLRIRADRFRKLGAEGFGVVALSYRGYGGSSGSPSEAGLIEDARAAYDFAIARYPARRIALWGESLGSGVAVALASERAVAAVMLEAPFTSAMDVGARVYWFLPVRLLMKDQFRSDLRIEKVAAPLLILHGERDTVVPFAQGRRLFELAREPKRFVGFPEANHSNLDDYGAFSEVRAFLSGIAP